MNTTSFASNQSIVGIFLHWYKQLQSKQNQINQLQDSIHSGLTHSELIQTWENTLFQNQISESSKYYHINIIQLIDIFLYQGYFKLIDQYYQLPTKYVDEMNFLFALNSAIKVLTSICQDPALKSVLSSISSEIQDQVNFYDRSFLPSNNTKASEFSVEPNSVAAIPSAADSITSSHSLPSNNIDGFKNNYEVGYEKPFSEFEDALSTNSEDSSFGTGSHPSLNNNQSLLTVSLPASEIEQSDPMIRFLALLRKGGIDILMPQSLHDQLLACVYLSIKLIYNSSFRDLIEILMKIKEINILPDLQNVTKTKIRGVLALLKQSELMYTHVMENQSIRLIFAPMIHSFYDLRHFHDIYLQKFMAKNDLFIPSTIKQEIVWMAENEENHKKKLEETESYLHIVREFINAKPTLLKKSRKNAKKQQQQQQQQQNGPFRAHPPLPLGSKPMIGGPSNMLNNDFLSGLTNQHSLNDEFLTSENSLSAKNNNNSYQFSNNRDLFDDLPGSLPVPPLQQPRDNTQFQIPSLENNAISFSAFEKGQNRLNNQMLNNLNFNKDNNGMNGNDNPIDNMYSSGSNYKPNNFNQFTNNNNNYPRNMNSDNSIHNNKNNYTNNYSNNHYNNNYQSQNIDYPPSLYSNHNTNQDMFNHNNFSSNNSYSKPPRTWNNSNNNSNNNFATTTNNNNRFQKYDSHPSFGSHYNEINNQRYDNNYHSNNINMNKNSRNSYASNHMNNYNNPPRPSLNSQFNPRHEFMNNDFNRQESSYSYGQNKFPTPHHMNNNNNNNNNMNQETYFSSSSLAQNLNNPNNNNIFTNKQSSFNHFGSNGLSSSDSNSFPFDTNTTNISINNTTSHFNPNSFDTPLSLMESSSRNPRSEYETRSSNINKQDLQGLLHDSYTSEKRMNFPTSSSEDKFQSNYFSTSPSSSMTTTQTMFTNTTF